MSLEIGPAQVPADVGIARDMFVEYQNWLDVDL
jgi:hypothetical protein